MHLNYQLCCLNLLLQCYEPCGSTGCTRVSPSGCCCCDGKLLLLLLLRSSLLWLVVCCAGLVPLL
jgi:hypothetical protein